MYRCIISSMIVLWDMKNSTIAMGLINTDIVIINFNVYLDLDFFLLGIACRICLKSDEWCCIETIQVFIKVEEIQINSNDCYLFYTNGNSTKPNEQSESWIVNRALKNKRKKCEKIDDTVDPYSRRTFKIVFHHQWMTRNSILSRNSNHTRRTLLHSEWPTFVNYSAYVILTTRIRVPR